MMEPYVLAPYFRCNIHAGSYYVGLGSKQTKITSPDDFKAIMLIASDFKNERLISDVMHNNAVSQLSTDEKEKAISFLKSKNLIFPSKRRDMDSVYSRQKLYYEYMGVDGNEVMRSLQASHICILGAGGIGNHAAFGLAAAGVGHLTLIDGDDIEESNLTRQFLYGLEDIGTPKVEALQRELKRRFPRTQIDVQNNYVDEYLNGVPNCDFLFVAADKPRNIMQNVARFCIAKQLPYINSGYLCDIAIVGPLVVPGKTGCTFCAQDIVSKPGSSEASNILKDFEKEISSIEKGFQTPSISSLNAISAGYAVLDVLKYLGGFGEPFSMNRRLGYHSASAYIEIQDCHPDSECSECGHLNGVTL